MHLTGSLSWRGGKGQRREWTCSFNITGKCQMFTTRDSNLELLVIKLDLPDSHVLPLLLLFSIDTMIPMCLFPHPFSSSRDPLCIRGAEIPTHQTCMLQPHPRPALGYAPAQQANPHTTSLKNDMPRPCPSTTKNSPHKTPRPRGPNHLRTTKQNHIPGQQPQQQ